MADPKAWSVILGAWCCLFCSYGWVNTIGLFQTYYQEDILSSYFASALSWIASVETGIIMYASSPIYGKMYDNHGPKPLLVWGTGAYVFGLTMASLGKEYYHPPGAVRLQCSGCSGALRCRDRAHGSWFLRHRALAVEVMASGSSLSGRLIPIIVARLLPRIGYLWTIRICAFLFLGWLCIAPLVVEPRVRPKPKSWELKAFFRPLREPAFLITTLGLSLFSWGMFIPFSFLVLEAQTHGMSLALANYQIAILNATSIFGRIIPGWLGDHIGRFNIAILTTALASIFALALWIPATTPALTIAFAALFGFTPGTFVSITPALIQQLSTVHNAGIRIGT